MGKSREASKSNRHAPTVSYTTYTNAELAKYKDLLASANAACRSLDRARLQLQIHAPAALGVDLVGPDDKIVTHIEKALAEKTKKILTEPGAAMVIPYRTDCTFSAFAACCLGAGVFNGLEPDTEHYNFFSIN